MWEGLIGMLQKMGPEVFGAMKNSGISGGSGGGGSMGGGSAADAAKNMPMAYPGSGQQGPMTEEDKKFMQQQQMAQNGQQNMQQMMQQGFSGVNNPGYKDMSQQGGIDSLMKMLMSMGGR